MKKKYKKVGGEKGNYEVLHNAIKDVEGKIHKLSEEEWQKFKESFRENFLMVLGFQEKEEYLTQQ